MRAIAHIAIILGIGCCVHADTVLFDNGDVTGGAHAVFTMVPYSVYEDFDITDSSILTTLEWSQFDQPTAAYVDTILTFYDALPSPSSEISSFHVLADRTPNGLLLDTPKSSGTLEGVDYSVTFSQQLEPGTYFVGITHNVSGGDLLVASTTGTSSTIPGFYQNAGPLTESSLQFQGTVPGTNVPFRVIGHVVPLPAASLMALPAFGLLVFCRRRSFGRG